MQSATNSHAVSWSDVLLHSLLLNTKTPSRSSPDMVDLPTEFLPLQPLPGSFVEDDLMDHNRPLIESQLIKVIAETTVGRNPTCVDVALHTREKRVRPRVRQWSWKSEKIRMPLAGRFGSANWQGLLRGDQGNQKTCCHTSRHVR